MATPETVDLGAGFPDLTVPGELFPQPNLPVGLSNDQLKIDQSIDLELPEAQSGQPKLPGQDFQVESQEPQIVTPDFSALERQPPPPQPTRSDLLLTDPVEFAARGGVVADRSELARMQGGQGLLKQQAVQADIQAQRVNQQRQAQKDAALAGFVEQTANEYAEKVAQIDAAARSALSDRQRRVDELSKKQIDPRRAFTDMGAPRKIMWVLGLLMASQTRNATGNMNALMQSMDNMVQRDIAAQKANLQLDFETLGEQAKLDAEKHKLDLKGLQDWSVQREIRYKALDRMLDAKIASMGNEAAERAGLLKAKAAINDEIIKGQATFQTQVQQEAESRKTRANQIYLARLNHQFRIAEQERQAAIAREAEERKAASDLGEKGVQAGGPLGLVAVDAKGRQVQGIVRARSAADARDAEEKLSLGNKTAGLYKILLRELDNMTSAEVAGRHFTPTFRAVSKELAEMVAKIHNDRITDKDFTNAAEQLIGLDTNTEGVIGGTIGVIKIKGDAVEGAKEVLKRRIASHENLVTQAVLRHIDARDKQAYRFNFKAQPTIQEPASGTRSFNETVATLGGGADVSDIQNADRRKPVDAKTADYLVNLEPASTPGRAVEAMYVQERDGGKLPKLDPDEQELVDTAREEFKQATPKRILGDAQALRRRIDKHPISDEARFQLIMEARLALREALDIEQKALSQHTLRYADPLKARMQRARGEDPQRFELDLQEGEEGYGDVVNRVLGSEAFKETRRRMGLVKDIDN